MNEFETLKTGLSECDKFSQNANLILFLSFVYKAQAEAAKPPLKT